MATLATLRNAVASKLGLDNTASSAEQTLIDAWLNEGVVDILLKTGVRVSVSTTTTTADEADYELDTDILRTIDLYLTGNGTNYSFERISPQEIVNLRRASSAVPPSRYYAVAGSNLIMLYPTPAGADTITLYYVARPTAMSVTSHNPSDSTYGGIPTEWHKAIEYYALWQGGDYADDSTSNFGLSYQLQYEKLIRDIRRYQTTKGTGRLPPARVNARRRRRLVPHSPSQDLG